MVDYKRVSAAPPSPFAREEFVRTRDGIHLATDVYLPGTGDDGHATEPGDTILIRLPYDKGGPYTFIPLIAEYFMAHGYRVVAQDVRGKFRSEGEALLFVNEVRDGYDTLEWIIAQPWSNGQIAMWGDSYYGYTQWAAAASGHSALKAIAPRVTGTALGEPVLRDGSRIRPVEMAITNLYPLTHFHSNDTFYWEPDWARRTFALQAEEFQEWAGKRSISYDQWAPHPVLLPRFPNGSPFAGRSVPVLHTIGWWDNCSPLSWADVKAIQNNPSWDAHHYLRVEPIDHESYQLIEAPGDRVEDRTEEQIRALLPRTLDPALQFFEVFVRGNGRASDIPRVLWNLAGTSEMRSESAWPPVESSTVSLYATGTHTLDKVPPSESLELSWTHNPEDLVPSSVSDAFSYLLHLPNEAPVGSREDVLAWTGPEQLHDVDLAGPVEATLTLGSSGPVMDCFVRLLDVAPNGTAIRIARGQCQFAQATEIATLKIDLGQIGYRLRAGHRLRIHLSSSDYPEFLPQPGNGQDPWIHEAGFQQNTQTLFLGGEHTFTIDLPVLKGELS